MCRCVQAGPSRNGYEYPESNAAPCFHFPLLNGGNALPKGLTPVPLEAMLLVFAGVRHRQRSVLVPASAALELTLPSTAKDPSCAV